MITVQANGASFNFPDDTPPETIKEAMAKAFPKQEEGPGLAGRTVDRIGGSIAEAWEGLNGRTGNAYTEGNAPSGIPVVGPLVDRFSRSLKGGAGIADAVGESVVDAASTAYKAVGSPFAEPGKRAVGAVLESAPVQAAGAAIGAATEAFPKTSEVLGDAAAVGSLMLPTKAPKLGPKVTSLAEKEAARHLNTRRLQVQRMLEPDFDDNVQYKLEGALNRKEWDPSVFDNQVIEEITAIPGVKPKASFTENHNVVREAAKRESANLDNELKLKGTPVSAQKVYVALDKAMQKIDKTPTLVGDAGASARRIYQLFKEQLQTAAKNNGGKIAPDELLQIRRDLDSELNIFKKSTEGAASAREVAGKEIRDALNDIVAEAAPNVAVKKSLEKSHRLLTARDILHERIKLDAGNAITRFVANFERASGFRHPTTYLAAKATIADLPVAATTLMGAVMYGTGAKIKDSTLIALRKAVESPQYSLKAAEKASIIALINEYRASQKEQEQQ